MLTSRMQKAVPLLLSTVSCAGAVEPRIEPPSSSEQFIRGPSETPCSAGEFSADTPSVSVRQLVADIGAHKGRRFRVTGYFLLQFERIRLVDPKRRELAILVDLSRLRVESVEELKSCDLKLVEIEGFVTHLPIRAGEAPSVLAETIQSKSM